MDCHHFEDRFEAYLAGELAAEERSACEAHLGRCPACRELLELAESSLPAAGAPIPAEAAGEDLVGRVLRQTSGPACGRAGGLLAARLDGAEPADALEGELLDLHLAACADCRGLARVLAALARDLPSLAEVRPDARFVDDVLARTLPAAVRWRRRRRALSRTWAAWVRRPRFAWEAAFVLTVACLPVLTSSASPIVPLAATARELAAEDVVARAEARIDRSLSGAGDALLELEGVRRTGREVAEAREAVAGLGSRTGEWAGHWAATIDRSLRTLRAAAASFLVKATDGDTEPRRPDDTNLTNPTDTAAGDGAKGDTP